MLDYMVEVKKFYEDFNNANFDKIDSERISELTKLVEKVHSRKIINYLNFYKGVRRYTSIMSHIRINSKLYNLNSKEEIYFLFMFCIDPNFDAFLIFNEFNTSKEIKSNLELKFGISDINLAKIEREFINKFMNKNEKKQIQDEINKRIWK